MEKKFNFRLEKVLNLRTQKVSQEKLAFGKVENNKIKISNLLIIIKNMKIQIYFIFHLKGSIKLNNLELS